MDGAEFPQIDYLENAGILFALWEELWEESELPKA